LTADNGAFYALKEGYMASWEGIERTYICLCQRANGQAVFVDMKLLGTTEGPSQTSDIVVLLHEYDRVLGMMSWHKHSDICDAWLCEGVIYHNPGGIYSLMTTYDPHIYPHKISFI
jgi:hypothetical protein